MAQTDIPDKICCIKNTEDETNAIIVNEVSTSENSTNGEKTEEPIVKEELILMASYTLGQCRQSKKDKIVTHKTISKLFKFKEPFLHEIPGVYWKYWIPAIYWIAAFFCFDP